MEAMMNLNLLKTTLAAAALGFVSTAAHSTIVIFDDFSSAAGLTLNGNTVANVNNGIDANPVLRLTGPEMAWPLAIF